MATRDELLEALVVRYREAHRAEKGRILTEFAEVTDYHRKHAERLLRGAGWGDRSRGRPERRLYDDAVREALVVLWEASDRICGKRLKPLLPMLIGSMEQHGHLLRWTPGCGRDWEPSVPPRSTGFWPRCVPTSPDGAAERRTRRRSGGPCRSGAMRTGADPPPGFVDADLVAHSGPSTRGSLSRRWCSPSLKLKPAATRGLLTLSGALPAMSRGNLRALLRRNRGS